MRRNLKFHAVKGGWGTEKQLKFTRQHKNLFLLTYFFAFSENDRFKNLRPKSAANDNWYQMKTASSQFWRKKKLKCSSMSAHLIGRWRTLTSIVANSVDVFKQQQNSKKIKNFQRLIFHIFHRIQCGGCRPLLAHIKHEIDSWKFASCRCAASSRPLQGILTWNGKNSPANRVDLITSATATACKEHSWDARE